MQFESVLRNERCPGGLVRALSPRTHFALYPAPKLPVQFVQGRDIEARTGQAVKRLLQGGKKPVPGKRVQPQHRHYLLDAVLDRNEINRNQDNATKGDRLDHVPRCLLDHPVQRLISGVSFRRVVVQIQKRLLLPLNLDLLDAPKRLSHKLIPLRIGFHPGLTARIKLLPDEKVNGSVRRPQHEGHHEGHDRVEVHQKAHNEERHEALRRPAERRLQHLIGHLLDLFENVLPEL